MSCFEFQISVAHFLTAQRNTLRQLAPCPPLLPAVAGVQIVVDRIDVGASSLRHDEETQLHLSPHDRGEAVGTTPGIRTMLAQDLVLQLTTDAEIHAKPNGTPALAPLRVTLVYDLTAYSALEDCRLSATLEGVELGPLPPLPPPLPARRVRFLNAGLAVDTTGQTLAIRVQVGGDVQVGRGSRWSNFFHGAFSDHRQGRDWALFVEGDYITQSVKTMLEGQLPRDDDLEAYPGLHVCRRCGQGRPRRQRPADLPRGPDRRPRHRHHRRGRPAHRAAVVGRDRKLAERRDRLLGVSCR